MSKICFLPFSPCNEIKFDIYNAGGGGDPIGCVKKVFAGCTTEIIDSDVFTVTFPPEATATQRANLLAAVMMIDFMYFETK